MTINSGKYLYCLRNEFIMKYSRYWFCGRNIFVWYFKLTKNANPDEFVIKYWRYWFCGRKFFVWYLKLTKNTHPDKYSYSGYGIGFNDCGLFSLPDGSEFGKNLMIFSADMSSSVHIDNKQEDILILGKGPSDGLDNTILMAEKEYSINFTK